MLPRGHLMIEHRLIEKMLTITGKELENMLRDFWEFDKKMIHEKYNKLYESLINKYSI